MQRASSNTSEHAIDAATEHIKRQIKRQQTQRRELAERLWVRRCHYTLARDDSLLADGDVVYIVDHRSFGFQSPIQEIDYFHSMIGGRVIAQMYYLEMNVYADSMVGMRGCFARAVGCIQRAFRARRF